MKRILLMIIVLLILLSLSACNDEFVIRGHHFGDSIEEVMKVEGDGEISGDDNYKNLFYRNSEFLDGLAGKTSFYFVNDKLSNVIEIIPSAYKTRFFGDKTIEEIYMDLISRLDEYGSPDEESKEDDAYTALWQKDQFGIVLSVTNDGVLLAFSSDPDKAKNFYNSFMFTDLL